MSVQLPTGTVTFLFTDIEGSTQLWENQPDAMRAAIARHDALLRQAVTQNNGVVFKTTGDGIAAAFATGPEALLAALSAQQSLLAEPWPEAASIRSRMGLHTGTAEQRDDDYFGQVLNRCARLMAAGHGSQILLSDVTQELCRDALPSDVSLLALGEHRLKDLSRPETIFALVHPDLPAPDTFPPLRSLDNPSLPNNLPQQVNNFIGREKQIREVRELLEGKSGTRLLTLVGAGGTGKTRLSLQVAADMLDPERFPDGAWQVELAPLSDPALIPQAVAQVLSVREQTGQTITQTLVDFLKGKRLLLFLDNCEHMIQACATLATALLCACPDVAILATSREPLNIRGEQTYRVPSLGLPDSRRSAEQTQESVGQFEAVRLFIDRAILAKNDFSVTNINAPTLAQVCFRLDGIPLAIELAASRVRSLTLEQINDKLDNRFRLLTGGDRAALPRQQTLRALIDWSYDLLSETEKVLLARLSVFAGDWTLKAAETVCGFEPVEGWEVLDLLAGLVDKSLVMLEELVRDKNNVKRYAMLETVRHYSVERLEEREEGKIVALRHAEWCVRFAEEAEKQLRGPEQVEWLSQVEIEYDNIRAALAFFADSFDIDNNRFGGNSNQVPLLPDTRGIDLAVRLWWFWTVRGYFAEARDWLEGRFNVANFNNLGTQETKTSYAKAIFRLSYIVSNQGDYETQRIYIKRGLEIFEELKDESGVARGMHALGYNALKLGMFEESRRNYQDALLYSESVGNKSGVAHAKWGLSMAERNLDRHDEARAQADESLALFRDLDDKHSIASLVNLIGSFDKENDLHFAQDCFLQSLQLFVSLNEKTGIANSLENLAWAYNATGVWLMVVKLYAAAGSIRDSLQVPLSNSEQIERDQAIAQVRSLLGAEEFAKAWSAGQALSWEQAVDLVLHKSE